MIVVADAGPLNYLVLIDAARVLEPLYQRVVVPQAVVRELHSVKAPSIVRTWILQPPKWCEIRPDPPSDPALAFLDTGEAAAIALAIAIRADR
jgi:predicted nucleic acid-binding protein